MKRRTAGKARPVLTAVFLLLIALPAIPRADEFLDDENTKSSFETHLGDLYRAGGLTTGAAIAKQLREAKSAPLPLPPSVTAGPGSDPVARARAASLVFGHLFLCGKCDRYHANVAGGVLLSPDGLVLTNHHVLDARDAIVFGAMTAEGQVYAVDSVLAASKADDLALVRLREAGDLSHASLAGDIATGDELFVLSHPDGHFFTLTKGYLARKYLTAKERIPRLQITADFAKGSSGSGIFNRNGELVGLATSTNSIYYTETEGKKDNLQMVIKSGVPLESIRKLFAPPVTRDP